MNSTLMKAILSMDSYNRGYNPSIKFGNLPNGDSATLGETIGNATIIADSRILLDENLQRTDQPADFYAVAYKMPNDSTWNNKTIISYRGTDAAADVDAYPIGSGFTGITQGYRAFEFYRAVATSLNNNISIDPRLSNIATTGHSLGGGLAGLVGANDNFVKEIKELVA